MARGKQMLAAVVLLLSTSLPVWADTAPQVSAGRLETVTGLTFEAIPPRTVRVWLPDNHDGKKLAVLYMHDGQMLFDASTTWNGQEWRVDEVAQQLIDAGTNRPFMVVAIDNAGALRRPEYFPQAPFESLTRVQQQSFYQFQQESGTPERAPYSDDYLDFLVNELKPHIDAHYPALVEPGDTYIMGSSMGGLISMYALTQYPEVFGGAACLSTHWPGIHNVSHNPMPEAFRAHLKHQLPKANSRKLYFDYGDQTLDALYPPLQQATDEVMKQAGWQAQYWQTHFFPGKNHSEQAWAERLHIPMIFLLGVASQEPR